MSNELKTILEKGQNGGQDGGNSETLQDKELREAKEATAQANKEVADLKFNSAFDNLSKIYPHANDLKDEIRKKFDSGYEADDAIISTLQKNGKLITADQITKEENKGTDLGGSANTIDVTRNRNTGEKSLEDLEKDFKEAESRGEIKFD